MDQEKDRLLSTAEAAERLGVSPRTIARWIKSGELRGVRLGKRIFRVPLGEVLRIIAETYERETPPEPMEKPSSLGEILPEPEPAPEPPEEKIIEEPEPAPTEKKRGGRKKKDKPRAELIEEFLEQTEEGTE